MKHLIYLNYKKVNMIIIFFKNKLIKILMKNGIKYNKINK